MENAKIKQALARIPYAQMLGVEPTEVDGNFTLLMPYIESNIGNFTLPALHGGAVSGFMEIAAISQLLLTRQHESLPKPIGINVDYLRRGNPKPTFARAKIFKEGRRIANVHVRAWQDDYNDPIATMHGNYLISKPE